MSIPSSPLLESSARLPILDEVTRLKASVDAHRPLPPPVEQRVMQKLRLSWNYNSNAIEGNRLTYGETLALLLHGVTANGKSLKDHLDIRGHDKALNQLIGMVKGDRPLTQNDIRELHRIILQEEYQTDALTPDGHTVKKTVKIGSYKTEPNHVKTRTGAIYQYVDPPFVAARMTSLLDWYTREMDRLHPLIVASVFHHEFVAIHPFDDGNGRLARILMNFTLMRAGYPPAVISLTERETYYGTLAQADAGEYEPLARIDR